MTKPNFEFNNKTIILTYKGHLEVSDLKFLSIKNTHKMFWEYGKTGYKHTHIVVMFAQKVHTKDCRFFDCGSIHPNVKKISTRKHWQNAITYNEASKKDGLEKIDVISDTLNGFEYEFLGTVRQTIQAHKCWQDVMNDDSIAKTVMRYMNYCKEVWACRPEPNFSEGIKLRAWQQEELDLLKTQDRRTIRWIYNKDGNIGKTILADYLMDYHNAFFCDGGRMTDIAHAFDREEYAVFDLPRTGEDFCPYKAIECLKNGRFFSPKYNSCRKRFRPVKLIVLANYLPNTNACSKDFWSIRTIETPPSRSESLLTSPPMGEVLPLPSPPMGDGIPQSVVGGSLTLQDGTHGESIDGADEEKVVAYGASSSSPPGTYINTSEDDYSIDSDLNNKFTDDEVYNYEMFTDGEDSDIEV